MAILKYDYKFKKKIIVSLQRNRNVTHHKESATI
jgi:hypothetical protein